MKNILEILVAIWIFVVVILTASCFAFTVHYETCLLFLIIKLISHSTEKKIIFGTIIRVRRGIVQVFRILFMKKFPHTLREN